jgi:hypothetical protein
MSVLTEFYALRWWLAAGLVIVYVASKYHTYKRLAAFKGPFSTGWSEIWHSSHIISAKSHLAYQDVNRKYGRYLL